MIAIADLKTDDIPTSGLELSIDLRHSGDWLWVSGVGCIVPGRINGVHFEWVLLGDGQLQQGTRFTLDQCAQIDSTHRELIVLKPCQLRIIAHHLVQPVSRLR